MAPRLCAWKAGRCTEERPMTRDGGGGFGSPWVDPAPPRRIWPEQAAPVRQRWETKVAASGDWAAGGSQRRRSACAEDAVAIGGRGSGGEGWGWGYDGWGWGVRRRLRGAGGGLSTASSSPPPPPAVGSGGYGLDGLCVVAGPGWRCADPRLVVGSVEPAAGYGLDGCGLRCQRPCPAPSSLPYPPSSLRRSITPPNLALLLALTSLALIHYLGVARASPLSGSLFDMLLA
uniref:Uncharacterized protein n=1 Tax=Oryza glumipatula TaxID=40148 RepID=A0A0E0BMT5_9ORYZ